MVKTNLTSSFYYKSASRGTSSLVIPRRHADYRNKVSLLEKPGAMLVENGEIGAWKRLKREEQAREETDEIRVALNY